MSGWRKISKEQFDTAYNKHLPSKWIKFAYKYFSKETEKKDIVLSNTITYILFSLFIVGLLSTAFKLPKPLIGTVTILYSIVLSSLVLYLLSAILLNNRRLKQVMKELGVNKTDYNKLIEKFYK
jgi:hypothetical protein